MADRSEPESTATGADDRLAAADGAGPTHPSSRGVAEIERAARDLGARKPGTTEAEPAGDDSGVVEVEPAAAGVVFGACLPAARAYVAQLAGPGTVRGLIGPREAGRLWTRHVLNCAVVAAVLPAGARVVDIGSGAGLPGIPVALARPDLSVDLVETLLRRTKFLDETVALLGLTDRCRVVRARAEDAVAAVGGADVVTARAVAPLGTLARWAAPLLRTDGLFVALKGGSAADEVERDRAECAAVGIVELTVRQVGAEILRDATTLIVGRRSTLHAGDDGRAVSSRRRHRRGGGRGHAARNRGRGR
jgi:16S rRNA (guanine527-N7)-methyltransferase